MGLAYDIRWRGFAGGLGPLCKFIDTNEASIEGGERGGGGTGGLILVGGVPGAFAMDNRCCTSA